MYTIQGWVNECVCGAGKAQLNKAVRNAMDGRVLQVSLEASATCSWSKEHARSHRDLGRMRNETDRRLGDEDEPHFHHCDCISTWAVRKQMSLCCVQTGQLSCAQIIIASPCKPNCLTAGVQCKLPMQFLDRGVSRQAKAQGAGVAWLGELVLTLILAVAFALSF